MGQIKILAGVNIWKREKRNRKEPPPLGDGPRLSVTGKFNGETQREWHCLPIKQLLWGF